MNPKYNAQSVYVRNIIGEPVDGYVRVTVDTQTFQNIQQSIFARRNRQTPTLTYSGTGDKDGKGLRLFNMNGTVLVTHYDKEARKTIFLMKKEDADKRKISLEDQRNQEAKFPVSVGVFNANTVAVV